MAMLFKACKHTEWRVKWFGLECFSILSREHPLEVSVLLPKIIPLLSSMVWDTKTQVSKSAGKALMDCCNTNLNPDVKVSERLTHQHLVYPRIGALNNTQR